MPKLLHNPPKALTCVDQSVQVRDRARHPRCGGSAEHTAQVRVCCRRAGLKHVLGGVEAQAPGVESDGVLRRSPDGD